MNDCRFAEQVTAVIKTFDRPWALRRLVASLEEFFPGLPIIVADDGKEPVGEGNYRYVRLPYDVGISAGRNAAVKLVETPYVWLFDHDMVVTEQTDLFLPLQLLETDATDLVGLRVKHRGREQFYYGTFRREGEVLHVDCGFSARHEHWSETHLVLNAFVAKTALVREVGWDEKLKLKEHWDFFYRWHLAGHRVGLAHDSWVHHERNRVSRYYKRMRGRSGSEGVNFRRHALAKHGLRKIVRENMSQTVVGPTARDVG